MWEAFLQSLEWSDWVAMCFLFIPSLLGVITGASLMYVTTVKENSQKSAKRQEPSMSDYRCTQANFTVLASDNEEIVERSIEEFEYHTDVIRWMGYGRTFQDFKNNVHISGRKGPAGIKHVVDTRLSPEARNTITIENDENKWGIDASLELVDTCALVLDIHHHWCREGEYIEPTDDRFLRIIDSWRGVRPAIHYSYSRNEALPADFTHSQRPNMHTLLESGYKKAKLRAHSDYYPNNAVNDWALSFLPYADIMCESKCKNLASIALHKYNTEKKNELSKQNVWSKSYETGPDPIII